MEYLKATALTLEVARQLPKGSGKKRLLFAPTKYLDGHSSGGKPDRVLPVAV